MSINAKPMTFRQAFAVKRRLQAQRAKSEFEIVGSRDMHFVRELRVRKNPRTGKKFHTIVMHGRELQKAPPRAVKEPRVLVRRAS